jgi:hypothetical protein
MSRVGLQTLVGGGGGACSAAGLALPFCLALPCCLLHALGTSPRLPVVAEVAGTRCALWLPPAEGYGTNRRVTRETRDAIH